MQALKDVEKKIFNSRYDWDHIDVAVVRAEPEVLKLIHEACLIESYFAVYTGKMMQLFWYDIEATSIFTLEAFEAYTHYYILRKYLDVVGEQVVIDEEIIELRKKDLKTVYDNEVRELVNFMMTEHFAAHYFIDLSAKTQEPVLKEILARLSKEEVTHSQFASDLLAKRLEHDSSIRLKIVQAVRDYEHIGSYVLPTVSKVKEDNIKTIQSFNKKIESLINQPMSDFTNQ